MPVGANSLWASERDEGKLGFDRFVREGVSLFLIPCLLSLSLSCSATAAEVDSTTPTNVDGEGQDAELVHVGSSHKCMGRTATPPDHQGLEPPVPCVAKREEVVAQHGGPDNMPLPSSKASGEEGPRVVPVAPSSPRTHSALASGSPPPMLRTASYVPPAATPVPAVTTPAPSEAAPMAGPQLVGEGEDFNQPVGDLGAAVVGYLPLPATRTTMGFSALAVGALFNGSIYVPIKLVQHFLKGENGADEEYGLEHSAGASANGGDGHASSPVAFTVLSKALGVTVCSLALVSWLPSLHLQLSGYGMIGGGLYSMAVATNYMAIMRAPMAITQSVWGGTAMLVSFFWGVTVLNNEVNSPMEVSAALLLLMLGTVASVMSKPEEHSQPEEEYDLPAAVILAILSGICGGTILLPLTYSTTKDLECVPSLGLGAVVVGSFFMGLARREAAYSAEEGANRTSSLLRAFKEEITSYIETGKRCHADLVEAQAAVASMIQKRDLCLPELKTPGDAATRATERFTSSLRRLVRRDSLPPETEESGHGMLSSMRTWMVMGTPGALSGIVWLVGLIATVSATYHVGYSIAYPLTHTPIIGGLWGLLVFNEFGEGDEKTKCVSIFSLSCIMCVVGAFLLTDGINH